MGRLLNALAPHSARALTANDAIRSLWQGVKTISGATVTEQSSLQVMAVLTAVRILAEGFAQVPLKVYRKNGDGREEAHEHRLYKILHERPNPEMTSFTLREMTLGHLATWGNSFWEIQRNFFDEPMALWPLLPDRTRKRRKTTGEIVFNTRIPKGENSWEDVTLPGRNVLHIPGFGFDGFLGYSLISQIREGVGLAKAYEEFGARFFANGAQSTFVLSTDKVMPKERRQELEQSWKENHEGLSNAHRFAILDHGLKPETLGMPLVDAQFIESRRFQRGEIFGFYRIAPHLTGDTEKASSWGTGIAEMSVGHIKFTMDPWFVRAEQAINVGLLGANAQGPLFCEFDREGFLRGDFPKRVVGYKELFNMGAISNVQIARLENLPKPPAEVWVIQGSMVAVDKVDAISEMKTKPPTPPLGPDGQPAPKPGGDDPVGGDAAPARALLARASRAAIADVTERILRRERADVSRGVEKLLKSDRASEIEPWLESFYAEHREFARRTVEPVLVSLFETVRADVGRELGRGAGNATPAFVRKYAEGFALRLGEESLEELRRAVRGEPQLERIFAAWERRELAVAARESVRAANAFALIAYRELGVAEVRWVALDGRADCQALSGRSVPIGDDFADRVSHPPLAEGCECVVVAYGARALAAPPTRRGGEEERVGQQLRIVIGSAEAENVAGGQESIAKALDIAHRAVDVANGRDDAPPIDMTPVARALEKVAEREQLAPVVTVNVDMTPVASAILELAAREQPTPVVNVTVQQPPKQGVEIVRDRNGLITEVNPKDG